MTTQSSQSRLRFVTYTEDPTKQSKRDLKAVRRHVMHDYFSRQRTTDGQDADEINDRLRTHTSRRQKLSKRRTTQDVTNRPVVKDTLMSWVPGVGTVESEVCQTQSLEPAFSIGCFQIEQPYGDQKYEDYSTSDEHSPLSMRQTPENRTSKHRDSFLPTPVATDASTTSSPNTMSLADSREWRQMVVTGGFPASKEIFLETSTVIIRRSSHEADTPNLQPSPAASRCLSPMRYDPFDSLPINGTYVSEMITWHFDWPMNEYNSWEKQSNFLNASINGYRRSQWSLTNDNKGLFHLFLCQAEAKKAVFTGKTNTVGYFYHRGQAIKEMMNEVQNLKPESAPRLATLIANMAGLSLGDDGPEAALVHLKAATKIAMKQTPGLFTFTEVQWRTLVWTDLRIAGASFTKPILPYAPRNLSANPPRAIGIESNRLAEISMSMMPEANFGDSAKQVCLIFQKLHTVCLIYDERGPPTPPLIMAHMGAYHWLVHHLCALTSEKCVLDKSGSDLKMINFAAGAGMLLAAELFAWSCMPSQNHHKIHLPPNKSIVEVRILRVLIRGLREQTGGDLVSFWQSQMRLEALIWVLVIAGGTCIKDTDESEEDVSWISKELKRVGDTLGYEKKEQYFEAFECFPSSFKTNIPLWPGIARLWPSLDSAA